MDESENFTERSIFSLSFSEQISMKDFDK